MIAFAGYDEACMFVDKMEKHANRHRDGIAYTTIVDQFIWAAQAVADLMLVSAHGPASKAWHRSRPSATAAPCSKGTRLPRLQIRRSGQLVEERPLPLVC